VRSWAKPLSHVRLHVQLQLHVCLHGAIAATIASCKHRVSGLHSFSYEARLKRLNPQSLELRRLLTDLMWCYKIIFGLVDIDVNQFFTLSSVPQTRGHRYKVLNHIVLEYVALSFVKELSMSGITYLWMLIF